MILDDITVKTKERIAQAKRELPLLQLKSLVADLDCETGFPFEKALRQEGISFICEVKKASPSKGIIVENFPYKEIAAAYEAAGAHAVSVLTEPAFFKGENRYLTEIRKEISIPILRKDFTVDEYMIYEAKSIGADAVLLICSILSESQLKEYVAIAKSLGLSALVEVHDETELRMALDADTAVIGVNNRDLKDFSVDINNSRRLRLMVPESILFVSESGMKTPEDIIRLRDNGTDAVLIGETLMRSPDKKAMLDHLTGKQVSL